MATGAAALSFRGTADYAEKSHAVDPGWGWIVPLVVEAGVLTAAAIAWVRSGDGMTARVETTVMASLLTLSVVINVANAATTTLLGHVVAATPPLVLLVAVEGLLREQRRVARLRVPLTVTERSADGPLTEERPDPNAPLDDINVTRVRQVSDAARATTAQPAVTTIPSWTPKCGAAVRRTSQRPGQAAHWTGYPSGQLPLPRLWRTYVRYTPRMDRFMNEEIPKDIPVKLPGPSYSVISRLVLLDGSEEYRPSKAVRWSRSHVMIKLQERDGIEPEYVWLRVEDVQRVLRRPPSTAS